MKGCKKIIKYLYDDVLIWRFQIYYRSFFEKIQLLNPKFFRNSISSFASKKVIYLVGMPRTGSSFLKNYFGDYDHFEIQKFQSKGFHVSLGKSLSINNKNLIDKSTHYIRVLKTLCKVGKDKVAICCIVRDPRDQLSSLFEFERHPELSRNENFWRQWTSQYSNFFESIDKFPDINFFLCRYEDVVKNPKKAKKEFIEWAGYTVVLERLTTNVKIGFQDDIQDDKLKSKKSPMTTSIGSYKKLIDSEQKNIVNYYKQKNEIIEMMEVFGYSDELKTIQFSSQKNLTVFNPYKSSL